MANGAIWRDNFPYTGSVGAAITGQNYSGVAGTSFTESGNTLQTTSANEVITGTIGATDLIARIQVVTNPNGGADFFFRRTDANNWLAFRRFGGSTTFFYKSIGGVTTLLGSLGGAANGDLWSVSISGTTVTWSVNGVIQLTYTITDPILTTGTLFGIGHGGTAGLVSFANLTIFGAVPRPAIWVAAPASSPPTGTNPGTSTGDGSVTSPLDWVTAMTDIGLILGGDTVLVRGGAHGVSGGPIVSTHSLIGGTSGNPTTIKRYPGDGWPRIYLGLSGGTNGTGWINFSGLQFIQNNPQRINNYRGDNPTYGNGGIDWHQPNCRFDYCIVANNNIEGWFYGEQSLGTVVHMCLTYYNGFRDLFNGLPAGQGIYRQADDAGTGQFQYLDTCITALNYQSGMQVYGSGASKLQYAKTTNSLWFYGGYLGETYSGGQAIREYLLGSTSTFVHVDQVYFDNNWLWASPQEQQSVFQLGYTGRDNTFTSFTNNVVYGPGGVQYFRNLEYAGNTFVQPLFNGRTNFVQWDSTIGAQPVPSGQGIDKNTYYVSNDGDVNNHAPLIENNGTSDINKALTPSAWFALTGYEQHSTLTTYGSQPTMWTVKPNTYEPQALWPTPRAFIYVFNFRGLATIAADVSTCLQNGDTWALYDWGSYEQDNPTPIQTGVYSGAPITITLGGQQLPVLIADPAGQRSQNNGLPPAGVLPGAYILAKTGSSSAGQGGTGYNGWYYQKWNPFTRMFEATRFPPPHSQRPARRFV